MKISISYPASSYYTDNVQELYSKVRKDVFIKQLKATSMQTQLESKLLEFLDL